MYMRLKELRNKLGLTQAEFAKSLGIGQSTLGMMEVGKREISDRHIKTICAIYHASEDWLRNGAGEMFVRTPENILDDLKDQYKLDNIDMAIFEGYLSLGIVEREAVKKYIFEIAERVTSSKATSDRDEEIIRRMNNKNKMIAEEQKSNVNK